MTNDQMVAATIIEQLGGNRFQAMTGSKNFVAIENGLTMKLARNQSGAQYLKIVLNSMDTYDMTFFKVNGKTLDRTTVAAHDGIYDDMLQAIFTKVTGFYTRM